VGANDGVLLSMYATSRVGAYRLARLMTRWLGSAIPA